MCFQEKQVCSVLHFMLIIVATKCGHRYCSSWTECVVWCDCDHTSFLFNTASQMWCLAQLLPIIIGEMVPVDDEHWQNFLDLLVIIDYVFAPVISLDSAAFLHDAICSHHEQFCRLCFGRSIKPKLHYMIHIPEWILKWVLNANVSIWVVTIKQIFFLQHLLPVAIPFILCRIGPLIRHWCMWYEAKHSYFKRLAKNAWNFRNIGKTLVSRHQWLMCYYLNSAEVGHSFMDETISTGRGKLHCMHIVIMAMCFIIELISSNKFSFYPVLATLLHDASMLECLQESLPHHTEERIFTGNFCGY